MKTGFRDNFFTLMAGTASLAVFMGLGRFAYTPIIPYMQAGTGMSDTLAGAVASSNYFGYLAGTVLFIFFNKMRYIIFVLSLVAIVFTSIIMGLTTNFAIWHILRFIAGFASASGFILSTSMLFDYLVSQNAVKFMGWHYSGVGLGIALSGLLVPFFGFIGGWRGTWIFTGITAAVFSFYAVFWIKSAPEFVKKKETTDTDGGAVYKKRHTEFWFLCIAYLMEGFGYVVIATFLVSAAQSYMVYESVSYAGWVIVGVFAAPSTIFWLYIARVKNFIVALLSAFTIQLTGLVLFVLLQNVLSVFIVAVALGGTFMGITSLSVTYGKELWVERSTQAVAILTTFFSGGQMIGPVVAGYLSDKYDSFTYPLLLSSGFLVVGIIFLFFLKNKVQRRAYAVCKH